MRSGVSIRQTEPGELPQVCALHALAFPDEDLGPLVSALLDGASDTFSLAAFAGDALMAHVAFTIFAGGDRDRAGALLSPLGVAPSYQRCGLGSTLVREGLDRMEKIGVRQVFVLGDPAWYGRLGFAPERQVLPPYALPADWLDAWQSTTLADRESLAPGRLLLPSPWMDKELWAP